MAASTFAIGAPSGMNTKHGTPRARAAYATAWAWLPALPQTTPRGARVAERSQLRERAAQLERARPLEVLGLELDGPAAALAQRAGAQYGRFADDPGDDPGGTADVVGRDRRARIKGSSRVSQGIATTASISTSAPRGSPATAIATRAGGSDSKNDSYTSLTDANDAMSVR